MDFFQGIVDVFEGSQTFVAALIALAGILVTLRSNAALARLQHEREGQRQSIRVRNAILGELRLLDEIYKNSVGMIELAKSDKSPFLLIPTYDYTGVYDAMVGKLGELTSDEVAAVVRSYGVIKQAPDKLNLLRENPGQLGQPVIDQPYIQMHWSHYDALSSLYAGLREVTSKAIAILEAHPLTEPAA